jgi:CheY-like chemotaxis protein
MLETEPYHLVITDIQMPGMSGTDLCEEILRRYAQPTKPVVVGLTAEVSKAMDEKCAKSGMLTVLHKPLTAHQLKDFFDQVVCKAVEISDFRMSEEKTEEIN